MKIFMVNSRHFLFALLISIALAIQIHAQDQSGFISLGCGLPEDLSYTETTTTGIAYISDAPYIETGVSRSVQPEFRTGKQRQVWSVRSFPEGERNCYNLTLRAGDQYLVRATFMYGNYDGKNELPEFDLYVGPNFWVSTSFSNASTDLSWEIIHVLQSDYFYFCLVNTGKGTPFISALELRLLKNITYQTQTGSLELIKRYDVGSSGSEFMFPGDIYDRFWLNYTRSDLTRLSTVSSIDSNNFTYNDFQPPFDAMRTAATPANASDSLDFSIDFTDPSDKVYAYMHLAEVQELESNQSRMFNISYNGVHWFGPYSPRYLATETIHSKLALTGGGNFSIYRTRGSTLSPILNAIEIYREKDFLQPQTASEDVIAITTMKSIYGLKRNWQGDPCSPLEFIWKGLNCSSIGEDPPRITSLNLSSSGLTGEIPPCIASLTELQYLDLSNNSLNGSVPVFLSQLQSLKVLNLKGNRLNGSIPEELIRRSNNGLLLSVEGNPDLCASVSCTNKEKKKNIIVPVTASIASFSVLILALAIFWRIKRRKSPGAGKMDVEYTKRSRSFESNNQHFTYSEVLKITNNFERVLGKGGFGTVYHGYTDTTQVAVKMLSSSSVQGYKQFQAEVEILLRVHHRNLTSLIGYCDEGTHMGLLYEYMANGSLEEHLSENGPGILSWEGRLQIVLEAALGLEYLHNGCRPPIIHRDVKCTNILLNECFQAKLSDFGLSKSFPIEGGTHVSTVVAGTPGYLDPEYYISNRLAEKSDVYSFGVVLLEVITSRSAIGKDNAKTHISQWVSFILAKGDIKSIVDPRLNGDFDISSVWKAVEVAMACVSLSSTKRPTMNNVVIELSECLAKERSRRQGSHVNESQDTVDMVTVNFGSEISPLAR